jgi:NADH-quinone oxidoreductase subunit N
VRIVKLMYFDEPTGIFDQPIGGEMRTVLIVTAAFILFFFVMPGPLLTSAEVAAAALFAG